MYKLRLTIALWLTIAATGVWADTIDSVTVENQTVEVIPDQVKMSDGTVVTARRLPRRAPDEDYTLKMFQTIRETVKETLPNFPIEMPLFYGGSLSAEKLSEYFRKGIIDGVFWDSRDITAEEFASMIRLIG